MSVTAMSAGEARSRRASVGRIVLYVVSIALTLMGFGPWCLLQGIRMSLTGRKKSALRER